MFFWGTRAQRAGKKAGQTWMKMSDQLDEDIESLTGRELLAHAQEEARQWLRSTYTYGKHGHWEPEDRRKPEQKRHEEFLEYVEAFIAAFPPISRGYPKE